VSDRNRACHSAVTAHQVGAARPLLRSLQHAAGTGLLPLEKRGLAPAGLSPEEALPALGDGPLSRTRPRESTGSVIGEVPRLLAKELGCARSASRQLARNLWPTDSRGFSIPASCQPNFDPAPT
jgi:hypothetical protein